MEPDGVYADVARKVVWIVTTSKEKYFEADRGRDLRRRENGNSKVWQVDKIWDVHHEIARRIMLGQKGTSIAEDLSVSSTMVSLVRNSPVVKERLEIMHAARDDKIIEMAKYIKEKAPEALKLLDKVIEGEEIDGVKPPLGMRVKEANNWVDRAGYKAPQRVEGAFMHGHYTADEIEEIKKESAARTAKAITAEVITETSGVAEG